MEEVTKTLRGDFQFVTKWFYENYIVLNSGKIHFVCLGNDTEKETYFFINTEMKNRSEEEILRRLIDSKRKFKSHAKNLFKKAPQKIWALSFLTNNLNDSEKN